MASGAPGKPAADQGRGNGTGGGEAYSQAMDCRSRSRSFYSVNPFTQADIGNRAVSGRGWSFLGVIAAAILLVPLLTNLLSRWLEVICGAILGNEGRLSARNYAG